MTPEDYERIDWMERMAQVADLKILATDARFEVCLGRVTFSGWSLRGAIDQAMEATVGRSLNAGK